MQLRISTQKSKLYANMCKSVIYVIDWKNVKIFKPEPHVNESSTAKSFLKNQKAEKFNVLNHNDDAILPGVYKLLLNSRILIYMYNFSIFLCDFFICNICTQV